MLAGRPHRSSGGRSLNDQVMDTLYTLCVNNGNGPKVSDGLTQGAVRANLTFPYLAPPAMALTGTNSDGAALYIKLKGDEEPTLISPRTIVKSHVRPERMSTLQFVLEYRSALAKAGWEIVEEVQGDTTGDAMLSAHYARNGRDIWASIHFGAELSISVAEMTGDLAVTLAKECHLPLYDVTFEFNKATLRPESESALQRVATALDVFHDPALLERAKAEFHVKTEGKPYLCPIPDDVLPASQRP